MLSWDDLPHRSFPFPSDQLSLRWTFGCGQAFRWSATPDGWWIGVVRGAVLRARAEGGVLTYAAHPGLPEPCFWREYLRLEYDLPALYREAGAADPHVAASFAAWAGLRVLRQEPLETIASYLCTTANSIPRIARAIDGMSREWGEPIATVDGTTYYGFPPLDAFAPEAVPRLRLACNLGYRADVLVRAMQQIGTKPEGWADGLRALPYAEARRELIALPGIGPKVADCVCLFALDKDEAVPVDTHVRQIAQELYFPGTTGKTLTAGAYDRIGDYFRSAFGPCAGWVQQYLFFSHLMRRRDSPVL